MRNGNGYGGRRVTGRQVVRVAWRVMVAEAAREIATAAVVAAQEATDSDAREGGKGRPRKELQAIQGGEGAGQYLRLRAAGERCVGEVGPIRQLGCVLLHQRQHAGGVEL